MKLFLPIAIVLGLLTSLCHAQRPWVLDKNGDRIEGVAIRSSGDGTIILKGPSGKEKSFAKGTYRKVYKPMPDDFKRAVSDFNAGNFDGAIPQFTAVEKANRYLNWDLHAGSYLVKCYLGKNQPDLASQTVGRLMSVGGKGNPIVVGAELEAMIGSGKADSANRKISSYVAGPNRGVAAIAQCRRGDVSMSKNLYEQAVMDYLRTVAFFEDVDKEIIAEAKFKTGLALKRKKDGTRAKMMFDRVQKDHPGSYWALRAAAGE